MINIKARKNFVFAASWALALTSTILSIIQAARFNNIRMEYEDKISLLSAEVENIKPERQTHSHDSIVIESAAQIMIEPADEQNESAENLNTLYTLPPCNTYEGMKCYEDYRFLTDETSAQYAIQQLAYTDEHGFRKIDDRYLVAIGTYFDAECGTLFDIILENGEKIPSIVGDIKADIHTDVWNVYSAGKCATEFIVDTNTMDRKLLLTGDISHYCEEWQSKVEALYVYETSILTYSEASQVAKQ